MGQLKRESAPLPDTILLAETSWQRKTAFRGILLHSTSYDLVPLRGRTSRLTVPLGG